MKKAFSFMEVIIAIVILSFAMLTLIKMKSDSIYRVQKSEDSKALKNEILLAADFKEASKRNEKVFLTDKFNIANNDLRRKLKEVRITRKDKKIDTKSIEKDGINFNIVTYSTTYEHKGGIKKKFYSYKIEQ